MKGQRHVFLVGMPGSGKTTVGRMLARLMRRPFVDADQALSRKAGHSVSWIFANRGEKFFRRLERQVLRDLAASSRPLVVATGGGAVLLEANLRTMKAHGRVVYIETGRRVLHERLRQTAATRPLMRGGGLRGKIEAMASARLTQYRKADLTVRGSRPAGRVAETLAARLKG